MTSMTSARMCGIAVLRVCTHGTNDAITVLHCTFLQTPMLPTSSPSKQVVAVMMKTAQGNPSRVDIVKELAPQCSDLSTNKSTITSLLSEFEKMLVDVL